MPDLKSPPHQAGPVGEPLTDQIARLGNFLLDNYADEIGRGYPDGTNQGDEGAIDVAIRLLNGGTNPAPTEAEPWTHAGTGA